MIPLHVKSLPQRAPELAEAMDQALRRYVRKEDALVTISSRVFPYLDKIDINFDGGEIDSRLLVPPKSVGETKPACEAGILHLSARKVFVQGAPLNLQLEGARRRFPRRPGRKR